MSVESSKAKEYRISALERDVVNIFTPVDALISWAIHNDVESFSTALKVHRDKKLVDYRRLIEHRNEIGKIPVPVQKTYRKTVCGRLQTYAVKLRG